MQLVRESLKAVSILIAMLTSLLAPAMAQERWSSPLEPDAAGPAARELMEAIRSEDWLEAAHLADAHSAPPHSLFSQYASFLYGWVGRHDLVQQMREQGRIRTSPACQGAVRSFDTIMALVQAVDRDPRIIILQERHSEARHRLALLQILAPLRERGFEYLAVEDLRGSPEAFDDLTSAYAIDGFHSANEPIFGEAIRQAIRLGYRLIPYEADFPPPDATPRREWELWRARTMAQNIFDRTLAQAPDARVLVFAGEGHAREAQTERMVQSGYQPMALVLKHISGLDPVTIDQTGCEQRRAHQGDGPDAPVHGRPVLDAEGFAPSTYDAQIQHGPQRFAMGGRAEWLTGLGHEAVGIPAALRSNGEAVVVEARPAGQPDAGGAPIDRLYLAEDEEMPLMLPPGRYVLRALLAGGERRESGPISVGVGSE